MAEEMSEQPDAYLTMTTEDIARLILCLIIEDTLRTRLAAYRPHDLPPEPVEGFKEFGVVGRDVVASGHAGR